MMTSTQTRYVGAAVLIVAISLLFILNQSAKEKLDKGQKLTDGSVVILHGDSKIEMLKFDEGIREVKIIGRAYFDIKKDEERPFIVHTKNSKVVVLGASFVVDTYEKRTEVRVESGLVKLIKYNKLAVNLEKGEMGIVSKHNKGIIKKNNRDINYLAWKTKIITFNETSMEEMKEILEDVYEIEVNFENPVALWEYKLTATLDRKKVKDAIEIIAHLSQLEYDYSNGKVVFKEGGCHKK